LLNLLREQGEINQRQIAESLDISDMAVSRMVKTLEANSYVRRRRAQGAEWLVSLA
jgi:DNA-binding MarR family transcriptional regulator